MTEFPYAITSPETHKLITGEMDRALDDYLDNWPQRVVDWKAR